MLTFHKIVRECAAGNRQAWRHFVAECTPLFTGLLKVYVGEQATGEADAAWRDTISDLAVEGGERLRSLSQQSEREFLIDVRRLALERALLAVPDESEGHSEGPPSDRVRALLEGLPLVHQQVMFLKLCGYTDGALEKMLRITPGVAKQGFERLRAGDCFSRAAWLRVLQQAWADHTQACPAVRMLIRIQDGQVTWYDRDPIERHVATCTHCLEVGTALSELRYWRKLAHPLTLPEAEKLLTSLLPGSRPATTGQKHTGFLKTG
jgi:hypothetical protein